MQYGITSYSYHAVCYIPLDLLVYDWKFVSFDLYPFFSLLTILFPTSGATRLFYEFVFVVIVAVLKTEFFLKVTSTHCRYVAHIYNLKIKSHLLH